MKEWSADSRRHPRSIHTAKHVATLPDCRISEPLPHLHAATSLVSLSHDRSSFLQAHNGDVSMSSVGLLLFCFATNGIVGFHVRSLPPGQAHQHLTHQLDNHEEHQCCLHRPALGGTSDVAQAILQLRSPSTRPGLMQKALEEPGRGRQTAA